MQIFSGAEGMSEPWDGSSIPKRGWNIELQYHWNSVDGARTLRIGPKIPAPIDGLSKWFDESKEHADSIITVKAERLHGSVTVPMLEVESAVVEKIEWIGMCSMVTGKSITVGVKVSLENGEAVNCFINGHTVKEQSK